MGPRVLLVTLLLGAAALPARGDVVAKRVGTVSITADDSRAWPGGYMVVRVASRRRLGSVIAILDGRRVPLFATARGLRALVPLSVLATPGPAILGIEIRTSGRQRIPINVTVAPRRYPPRTEAIPEDKRALLVAPARVRDGRLLLRMLRVLTPTQDWTAPLRDPVAASPEPSFGAAQTWVGGSPVERLVDATWGEYHRGLDYPVPPGTVVRAPAGGTVVLAQPLLLSGRTVVVDHGNALVSALYHLSRIDVRPGDAVHVGQPLGLSGDSGITPGPRLHWGTYLYGIAVDPRILQRAPID